ncbi:hypothetical protein HO173_003902 [Letharia columbiana]|uniref:Uncharacterized protein n=1 Tax=Letharia columbiana TaxID=112416 RepID=A0A8H6L6V2_9LECA|nr:uncharacterized protein HO173_003902 [Letharia columbiana]KAF6237701.1 hypothetical protein HO173_003902 [Letharia columbiana]
MPRGGSNPPRRDDAHIDRTPRRRRLGSNDPLPPQHLPPGPGRRRCGNHADPAPRHVRSDRLHAAGSGRGGVALPEQPDAPTGRHEGKMEGRSDRNGQLAPHGPHHGQIGHRIRPGALRLGRRPRHCAIPREILD